jgi:hypothetical protein
MKGGTLVALMTAQLNTSEPVQQGILNRLTGVAQGTGNTAIVLLSGVNVYRSGKAYVSATLIHSERRAKSISTCML